jgi:hypothetical protein
MLHKKRNNMRRLNLLILISVYLVAMLSGCSEESTTEPTPNITAPLSKLSDIQSKVFNQNCATSGCHGATNTQANLLLTDGSSHGSLVSVPSILYPQFNRVEPFSSANSLLIKILKGEVNPRMPYNGTPLASAVIDSIAKWIDKGALND